MRLKSASNSKMLVLVTLFAFVASCVANEATHQFAMEPLANSTFIKESTDTLSGEERVFPLSFIDHIPVFSKPKDMQKFSKGLGANDLERFIKRAGDFATAKAIAKGGVSTGAQHLKIGLFRRWVDGNKTPKEVLELLKINNGKSPSELLQDPLFLLWIDFVMMKTRVKQYGTSVYRNYELKAHFLNVAAQLQKKIDLLEKEWKQTKEIRLTEMKNRLQEETQKVKPLSSFEEKKKLFNEHFDLIQSAKNTYNEGQYNNWKERSEFMEEDDDAFKAMIDVLAEKKFKVKPLTGPLKSLRKEMYRIDAKPGYTSNPSVKKFD